MEEEERRKEGADENEGGREIVWIEEEEVITGWAGKEILSDVEVDRGDIVG
jgi:hypothetical protein